VKNMNQNLKQSVVEKFRSLELSPDQLAKFEIPSDVSTTHPSPRRKRFGWPAWSIATAAAVILSIGGFLANQMVQEHNARALLEAIAVEVVDNHLKLKPLEVESSNLRDVLSYFDRLEFQLLESSRIAGNAGDQLLGGRYCSIQGIDAAQLRVASADGELSTWYQATLPMEKLEQISDIDDGDKPAEFVVKGLRVSIWREQGIVFAQARRPAPDS
jgi:hypothetical protein